MNTVLYNVLSDTEKGYANHMTYLEIFVLMDTCCYQSSVTQVVNIEWHDQGKLSVLQARTGTEKSYLTAILVHHRYPTIYECLSAL